MIQKTPARSRSRKAGSVPSSTQIARRRQRIQSEWSSEERTQRRPVRRQDTTDLRLEAHLRFIEFLLATQSEPARPSGRRRK